MLFKAYFLNYTGRQNSNGNRMSKYVERGEEGGGEEMQNIGHH